MNLIDVLLVGIEPALALLPAWPEPNRARAMLLAIGLQESRFEHRRQLGGPARGFWQFEAGGGVAGVLSHAASRDHARATLGRLSYLPGLPVADVHARLEHNDVLAAVFARLLLRTHPRALPGPNDTAESWRQYEETWRPGKPHPSTWPALYARAWEAVG